jgi:hypothetical protein
LAARSGASSRCQHGPWLASTLRGTAWGAFQAWTEDADHHRALRDTGRQDPKRAGLESIWMGRSAATKQAALTAIAFHTGIQLAAA